MPKPGVFLSLNLTQGTSQEVDAGLFARPLFLDGKLIVAEVVFWSNKVSKWVLLVSERTQRPMPPGAMEVATSELDYYESVLGIPLALHEKAAAADARGHARKFNDRDMFLAHFEVARSTTDRAALKLAVEQMDDIVGRNQNGPEHGADGSFTVEAWTAARDALKKLREAHTALGNL
jgi:hypothetical protein